jgi:hypothetical protein
VETRLASLCVKLFQDLQHGVAALGNHVVAITGSSCDGKGSREASARYRLLDTVVGLVAFVPRVTIVGANSFKRDQQGCRLDRVGLLELAISPEEPLLEIL